MEKLVEGSQLEGDRWVTNERYDEVMRRSKKLIKKMGSEKFGRTVSLPRWWSVVSFMIVQRSVLRTNELGLATRSVQWNQPRRHYSVELLVQQPACIELGTESGTTVLTVWMDVRRDLYGLSQCI